MQKFFSITLPDIALGLKSWRIWLLLGWQDISLRYRRSVLGPWWISLSMLITVCCLGLLYGRLFNIPINDYLPYLATGLLTWTLILTLITEGTNNFVESASYLKQIDLPYSVFILRAVTRNTLVFFHNIIPILLVLWFCGIQFSWEILMVFVGLAVIIFNGFCYGWILAIIGARFRDIQPIIASIMQIAFFLTPIIWEPKVLQTRYGFFINYNPFAQFIELIRQPLLGNFPSYNTWMVTLVMSLIGILIMFLLMNKTRTRIIYWL